MAKYDAMLLDEIRSAVPISEVVSRSVSWDRKKSVPAKGDYWACCPAHAEKRPSFHADDRKGRAHCFGCGFSADHFRFLMEIEGMTFPRAVEEVARMGGVRLPDTARPETEAERAERDRRRALWAAKQERDRLAAEKAERKRIGSAGGIWKSTLPLAGSLAEVYLRSRGGDQLAADDSNLRFHPGLFHHEAQAIFPCLVGRVQGPDGAGIAVWRIYLKPDGTDKAFGKDSGFNPKLGFGPAKGGAVRLGGDAAEIGIGEGIETCRAAALLGAKHPIWAGLSTSGIMSFEPPAFVTKVFIYPDGDKPRRREGVDYGPPGMAAAQHLKARLDERGLACVIVEPPRRADYLDIWNRARNRVDVDDWA
jgi:hypothetical protein